MLRATRGFDQGLKILIHIFIQKILDKLNENAEVMLVTSAFFMLFWIFGVKGRYKRSLLMLNLAMFSAFFYSGMLAWVQGLGGDSFLESRDFNWGEAIHWLRSFVASMPGMVPPQKILLFIIVVALGVSWPLAWLGMRQKYAVHVVLALLVAAHMNLVWGAYQGFDASRRDIDNLKTAFQEPVVGMTPAADVDLLVYIGESTSSLNMSLYGYPLPTTPQLDALAAQDSGFLKFDHVRSTQSHTSLSLLRALSVPSPLGTPNKRWGLGPILRNAGVNAKLFSVQPLTGSFSSFSRFIFDGLDYDLNPEDRFRGNMVVPAVKDHELIPSVLGHAGVTVFHSYAGHGAYLDLIDQGMSTNIGWPGIALEGLVGAGFSVLDKQMLKDAMDYNQAITYIDRNVAQVMQVVQSRAKPAVVMYFSDHGDSVFTRRGHESSRYIDEMTTVPFVLYFNAAYRQKYPEVYARYQAAVKRKDLKLLDQIVPTVLDVLRMESTYPLSIPSMAQSLSHPHPVIMERDTLQGASSLDFRYDEVKGFGDFKFAGGTPEPTLTWMINDKYKNEKTICYHRADSYAKALRAASVAGCIEFDLVVEGDKLSIYHPPAVATGFEVEHMFAIASHRKNKLWIDSKNLNEPSACATLQRYLERHRSRVGEIFVEFPAESVSRVGELAACAGAMKAMGVRTSYYVPTHWLLPCAQDPVKNASACVSLNADLRTAMHSGMFTDLSFDFLGYPAMKRVDGAEKFSWNTWTVKPQDFHKFPRQDFRYIIMDTSTDPNTY
jgi:glucan phosphoethanolaminetransferase (alkaline phosphatase superfamily)